MSWGLVAVGVGSVIVGGLAYKSSQDALEEARETREEAAAFNQQRYDDWQDTYGDLEENLAAYYSDVTPEYYAATGLEAFQTEFDQSMTRLRESLVQRGIDPGSGIAASLESQAEIQAAEKRAEIRRDAPRLARDEQRSFLQLGISRDPSGQYSQYLQNQALSAQQYAQQSEAAAGQAIGDAITNVTRGIDSYSNRPTPVDPTPPALPNTGLPLNTNRGDLAP